MHHEGLFRLWRRYPHPCLTSELVELRVGYRSGDVAERCQWQKKRGIRSGSGRNFVSESEQKISGTATGHNEAEPRKINIEC